MSAPPAKIPVTVIGGFLGAGKTTFLNHLLRSGAGRYAVLVNDFGAVNIDDSLIARHDGTTMTLTNGCVCCSIGDGFLETLGAVLDAPTAFDHIVIEASGVGDPWRIAEIALVEPSLRLNAVIVLADACRLEGLLADARVGDTVRRQFDRSDVVLLNKIDLVTPPLVASARAALTDLRAEMRIIETSERAMPSLADLPGRFASGFRADTPLVATAKHEETFRRWSYRRDGSFDRTKLGDAIRNLPPQLMRLKGIVRVADEADAVVLQVVGRDWALTPANGMDVAGDADILLVGIGTDELPESAVLDAILDRALVVQRQHSLDVGVTPADRRVSPFYEGQRSCR